MTKDYLLDNIRIPQSNIHRIHGEEQPEGESRRYTKHLQNSVNNHNGWPQFDLIILGLGSDGHTASIFPDQMQLLTAGQSCEVATHPESGQKRITMTGSVLNNARNVAFLVTGESKREKVHAIMNQTAEAESYPANFIRPAGNLYWYLDRAAAGDLK